MASSNVRKYSRSKLKIILIVCANCKIRVLPNEDGTCPSCRAIIPQSGDAVAIRPGEPSLNRVAIEEFTYQKSWKVITYIKTGALLIFALVMFGVGFFFVFPSGGQIVFGGMGWLYFIMATIGAIVGILQYMNAENYSVKLSEKEIRIGNVRADWAEIVKMESHMTLNDMAYGDMTAILLTTRQGSNLILPAATDNLPYIKKYIEEHANIIG
jgi:hypothetical protein